MPDADTTPPPTADAARRLVVAAGAEARLAAARAWLGESTGAALLIAPARGAADDLVRALGPRLGIHRRTSRQLAAELAVPSLARDGLAPVAGLGLEALAARTLASAAALGQLAYFAPVADTPGMPRALARTLVELRHHGVTPAQLEAGESPRQRDLARLLDAYETLLDRRRLVDPPGLLDAARAAVDDGTADPSRSLLGRPTLILDLPVDSTVEARFLGSVARRAPTVLATAIRGDAESIDRLTACLDGPVVPLDEPSDAPLGRLRRRIFLDAHDEDDLRSEAANDETGLVFLSAPGEEREAVEIARRLHALARDGVAFDECAVALRAPETYWPLLEEAMARASVPVSFTRGTRRPDPAGRALLALLACAVEHLSASRFAEYLSLGQLPSVDADGAPPEVEEVPWVAPEGDQLVFKSLIASAADDEKSSSPEDTFSDTSDQPVIAGNLRAPREWEKLLVDAAVIEGRDRWRRRLHGVLRELRLRQRELEADDPRRQRLADDLRRLRALERFALPLIDVLAELPTEATWGEWIEHLGRLAARAVVEPSRVLAVLGELRPMAEVGPVTLEEVRRTLEPRLATLRTEPRGERFGHVLVLTIDELRGRTFHTVFLPGLAEGKFPRRPVEDPLLPDADRRALDAELPDRDRRVLRERRLLRLAIGAATSQLVVSYPSLDTLEGRARVPSFYALDLLRAAEGRLPDLDQLARRAAAAAATRLGWPAPRDPARAIDDAEFDLATLVLLGAQPARGAARYLLETNPHLRRSLRNRYSRWASRISPADGMVVGSDETLIDPVRRQLGRERPTARSFSPTALQHFAACPYRFYLRALLGLRPRARPEPLERMDPLTRGGLFHEAQFELLTQLAKSRLLPMRERDIETLYNLADQTLDSVAARFEEELAPAIPRVWASELEGLRIDVRGWIRSVVSAAEPWRPEHFELAFGLDGGEHHDPASTREDAVLTGGRRLRGSIDMVEVSTEAHPAGPGRIRVTDHKTGRALPSRRHLLVRGGETLQPLLYALVAERLLTDADRPHTVDGGRLSYCTRRGGYQTLDVKLDDEGRAAIDEVFTAVETALGEGQLPAAPTEGACTFCDYRLVCGPREEARIQRKRPEQLSALHRLRRLP